MKPPATGTIPKFIFVFGLVLVFAFVNIEAATIICGTATQDQEAAVTPTAAATEDANKLKPNEESLLKRRDSVKVSASGVQTASMSSSSALIGGSPSSTTAPASDVKQFFQAVQCTLKKAKPWVEEIEKEAKRLEESAKRFGEGVISKLGVFMEKLMPSVEGHSPSSNNTETTKNKNPINSNPVKSLLSTILDGFGAVVSVVGGAAGAKTRPATVAPEVDRKTTLNTTTNVDVAAVGATVPGAAFVADVAATIEHADELENQIADVADADIESLKRVCPVGFAVDGRGLCQRLPN